jgi:hypothetical protein
MPSRVKTNHRLKGDGLDGSAESRPGYGPKPREQEGLLKAHRLKAVGLDLEMTLKRGLSRHPWRAGVLDGAGVRISLTAAVPASECLEAPQARHADFQLAFLKPKLQFGQDAIGLLGDPVPAVTPL